MKLRHGDLQLIFVLIFQTDLNEYIQVVNGIHNSDFGHVFFDWEVLFAQVIVPAHICEENLNP